MSKCFGDLTKLFKGCDEGRKYDIEDTSFFDKFENPEQYAKCKIRMLEDDMCIKLGEDEINHLKSLKTDVAIDAAVRAIINAHWE